MQNTNSREKNPDYTRMYGPTKSYILPTNLSIIMLYLQK